MKEQTLKLVAVGSVEYIKLSSAIKRLEKEIERIINILK